MDEGVKNNEKDLKKLKKEIENIKENSKPKILNIHKGSRSLDNVYKKVDKQERIDKPAQKDEKIHKEFLLKKEET